MGAGTATMDISVGAHVRCTDGTAGVCEVVIVRPDDGAVTDIVVSEKRWSKSRRLVPVDLIESATREEIRLRCTVEELHRLDDFDETERVEPRYEDRIEALPGAYGIAILEPTRYLTQPAMIHDEEIPGGDVPIDRHAEVDATDGNVGHVEGFLLGDDDRVTSVVVRSRSLPHRRFVVPASAVAEIADERVRLGLDRDAVHALPHAYDEP
jgi:uncharacterized protein YrrD